MTVRAFWSTCAVTLAAALGLSWEVMAAGSRVRPSCSLESAVIMPSTGRGCRVRRDVQAVGNPTEYCVAPIVILPAEISGPAPVPCPEPGWYWDPVLLQWVCCGRPRPVVYPNVVCGSPAWQPDRQPVSCPRPWRYGDSVATQGVWHHPPRRVAYPSVAYGQPAWYPNPQPVFQMDIWKPLGPDRSRFWTGAFRPGERPGVSRGR
jgi:hypothetical protein